ncbi:hypothetical protein E4T49_07776 [Aureobasidium sp. EXF-10728]|nr:hypothetical protein E4T49_07776 [Aureobasidium sp. EXF-10728]
MDVPDKLADFVTAMQQVYQFPMAVDDKLDWNPPPLKDGHLGRYLWTDAFGVLNFITLFGETKQTHFLVLAAILVETIHDILGRTRDLSARLPGASDQSPLSGGLRIGKNEASGADGDGQYHHHLTLWMFVLNRLAIATGDMSYNDQAVSLAKAIHPAFVYQRDTPYPRMVWKMPMDLSHPQGRGEGHLGPMFGLVTYRILQQACGDLRVLQDEISDFQKIIDQKWKAYTCSDTLDLGMTVWAAHWYSDQYDWAKGLADAALRDMRIVFHETHYLDVPITQRLAFREFGICLGIGIHPSPDLEPVRSQIMAAWKEAGRVPIPVRDAELECLEPMDLVMYAAALCPGAFKKDYLN